jgi:hypothetical protein
MKYLAGSTAYLLSIAISLGCESGRKAIGSVDGATDSQVGKVDTVVAPRNGDATDSIRGSDGGVGRDGTSNGYTGQRSEATDVCIAAIKAYVERLNFCFGNRSHTDYRTFAGACPDYYFGPDSKRSVAEVASGLDQIATWRCSDLQLGILPACIRAGRRPAGAGCAFSSQCQSNMCNSGGSECSTCRELAPIGAKCIDAGCDPDAFCDDNTWLCTTRNGITYVDAGQRCDLTAKPPIVCVGNDDVCARNATGWDGVCSRAPGLVGEACGGVVCTPGTQFCEDDSKGTCVDYAMLGQSCSEIRPDIQALCSNELQCWKGTCVAQHPVGDPCDDANPCGRYRRCVAGVCQALDCPP